MSSAANHRKRSHRSHSLASGAFGGMARRAYVRDSKSYSGGTLIQRLQKFKRRIEDQRKRSKEVSE